MIVSDPPRFIALTLSRTSNTGILKRWRDGMNDFGDLIELNRSHSGFPMLPNGSPTCELAQRVGEAQGAYAPLRKSRCYVKKNISLVYII